VAPVAAEAEDAAEEQGATYGCKKCHDRLAALEALLTADDAGGLGRGHVGGSAGDIGKAHGCSSGREN
jgi:hypothetical protein